jgi:hypothetical protein
MSKGKHRPIFLTTANGIKIRVLKCNIKGVVRFQKDNYTMIFSRIIHLNGTLFMETPAEILSMMRRAYCEY